jgi:N utilization substance protein B
MIFSPQCAPISYVRITPRTVARFAMVQAIFYAECEKIQWQRVVEYFTQDLFEDKGYDLFGEGPLFINRGFFNQLSEYWLMQTKEALTELFSDFLPDQCFLDRMDPTLHAILLCAVLEMRHCSDTPKPVLMNEYIIVAQSFSQNAGLVNAILEKVYTSIAEKDTQKKAD